MFKTSIWWFSAGRCGVNDSGSLRNWKTIIFRWAAVLLLATRDCDRFLLICISSFKWTQSPRRGLLWMCFTLLFIVMATFFSKVLPRRCLEISTLRINARMWWKDGKKNVKTVKGIIVTPNKQIESSQRNHTMYNTCSRKIIPDKKRNKPLPCIALKVNTMPSITHIPACTKNNITGPPTEIQHLFSIIFISSLLLKQHNKGKLIIKAPGTYFTVYQAIIYWRWWNNSIFDVTSHIGHAKETTRT